MNTEEVMLSALLILGPQVVNHDHLTVHIIKLGENPTYEKSKDEIIYKDAKVKLASENMIKEYLKKIDIEIDNKKTLEIVSKKFWKELTSIEGGKLAFLRESKTFYEIINI
jgi:hypothetical protein